MIAFIAKGLAAVLNIVIVILAVVEFFVTIGAGIKLFTLSSKISSMRNKMRRPISEKTVKTGQGQNLRVSRTNQIMDYHADLDPLQDEYEDTEKIYMIFVQIIPIFPLLGILGTVSGLYSSLSTTNNMNENVAFALSSTLLGLLFSIIFKGINMYFTAVPINTIENGLERYKEEYVVNNENREIEYPLSSVENEKTISAGEYTEATSNDVNDRPEGTWVGSVSQQSSGGKHRKESGTAKRREKQRT